MVYISDKSDRILCPVTRTPKKHISKNKLRDIPMCMSGLLRPSGAISGHRSHNQVDLKVGRLLVVPAKPRLANLAKRHSRALAPAPDARCEGATGRICSRPRALHCKRRYSRKQARIRGATT